ncbi:hypothetical protein NCCP2716_12850 [Sporosarcina sp. NCCP-2716]|uniref:PilN domain-containing protein n=1 Tax=Sporosarcina sp. NCCP-2716 TaxID=2943679 RepID=UPI00203AA675|nr:hypothetical protein [Sporosarcina sp. NCCP-2716]GKV68787.1 hypothetical protein NCCP2716_12850 [Sporosarcina sp. NCCP-2716]
MLVDINLLPEKERERSNLLYAALVIIGAALLFWLVFYLLTRSMTADTERLDGQLTKLQEQQTELSERLNRSDNAQAVDRLAASVQWAEDFRYATAPLLEDLTAQLPRRGFFRSFAFAAPHQATVEIQFDQKAEAAYYLTRILASESVETASIESIATEEIEETEETATGSKTTVRRLLPRYIATYTIFFTDPRATLDGTAPAVPEDAETPVDDAATDPAAEEPASEEPAADGTVPETSPDTSEEEGSDAQPD